MVKNFIKLLSLLTTYRLEGEHRRGDHNGAPGLLQVGHGKLQQSQHRADIGQHGVIEDVQQPGIVDESGGEDARIGHHHVQLAELGDRLGDDALHVVGAGQIGHHHQGLVALRREALAGLGGVLQAVRVATGHHDLGAKLQKVRES